MSISAADRCLQILISDSSWISKILSDDVEPYVAERLKSIEQNPLPRAQLNQLLVSTHQAPLSEGYFRYYWLTEPTTHPYIIKNPIPHDSKWVGGNTISSLPHLYWGLYRALLDGIYWFGSTRTAYRDLRKRTFDDIETFFSSKRIDTAKIISRGPVLKFSNIAKDDRYLISEMACKSFGDGGDIEGDLYKALEKALIAHQKDIGGPITISALLNDAKYNVEKNRQTEFNFSATDVLQEQINSVDDLKSRFLAVAKKFKTARAAALTNTKMYLSMVGDLDIYVATSMRNREDFRNMAAFCTTIFGDGKIADLHIRYFDPTMSAADGHEDKGLIECLMVKCAKLLIYSAGDRESYGKDAEAAMALSLGKPVIFYCNLEERKRFYRDVHPLSRLIQIENGIAVGSIVTNTEKDVVELIDRVFRNKMEYELHLKSSNNSILIRETLTESVVRIQTGDKLLSETFWNHYHEKWGQ